MCSRTKCRAHLKGAYKLIQERPPWQQKLIINSHMRGQCHERIPSNIVETLLNVSAKAGKLNALLNANFNEALQLKPYLGTFTSWKETMGGRWDQWAKKPKQWQRTHSWPRTIHRAQNHHWSKVVGQMWLCLFSQTDYRSKKQLLRPMLVSAIDTTQKVQKVGGNGWRQLLQITNINAIYPSCRTFGKMIKCKPPIVQSQLRFGKCVFWHVGLYEAYDAIPLFCANHAGLLPSRLPERQKWLGAPHPRWKSIDGIAKDHLVPPSVAKNSW